MTAAGPSSPTPTSSSSAPAPSSPALATVGPRRRRRRVALWGGLSALVVFAVFLALLATVGSTKQNSPLLGKPAPAVSGARLSSGRSVSLTDYAGKWVLVNFAASWCEPCQLEMPQLEAFAKVAPRMDATVFTVTYDPNDGGGLRSMLASDHATWPAVDDAQSQVRWGVYGGIPQSYLVDPQGLVVAYWASEVEASDVESTITQLSARTASSVGS